MLTYRSKYVKIGSFFRPIIPITLKYNTKTFDYLALVDSGADFNMFHAELAKILDIDLTRLKRIPFSGIKSSATGNAFVTAIDLGINNVFINSPVMFSNDISDDGYGTVGQLGFFNHFKITFDYLDKYIELRFKKKT